MSFFAMPGGNKAFMYIGIDTGLRMRLSARMLFQLIQSYWIHADGWLFHDNVIYQ